MSSTNSDGFVEVGPASIQNTTIMFARPPPNPPPSMKKEPRFPFFSSATRPRQLLEQPQQTEAFHSFQLVAKQSSSQPSGFYGPNSSSDSGSESEESSDPAESDADSHVTAPKHPTYTISLAHQRELFSKMSARGAPRDTLRDAPRNTPRQRRTSDAGSVGSAVTTASTNVETTVDKYVNKLEARLRKANPDLTKDEVTLMVVKEARAAHARATSRQQERTKDELKKLEASVKPQSVQASPNVGAVKNVKSQIEQTFSAPVDTHKTSPDPALPYVDKGKQVIRPTNTDSPKSQQKTPMPNAPRVQAGPLREPVGLRNPSHWKTDSPADAAQVEPWGIAAEDADDEDWVAPELPASKEPPLLPHPPRKTKIVNLDSAAADDADDEDFEPVTAKKGKPKFGKKQHFTDFLGNYESALPRSYVPGVDETPFDSEQSQPVHGPLGPWISEPKKKKKSSYHNPYSDDSSDAYESSDNDDPTRWNITNVSQRRFIGTNDGGQQEMLPHWMCNFQGCGFKCLKVKQMKNHKIDKHFVCVTCDMDFINYDALFAHKQATSTHIVCWQCGADFATTAARNRHMESFHPDDKKIECPGCGDIHPNQTSFIMHLEQKLCKNITDEQWNKARLMVGKMKELALIEYAENEKKQKEEKRAVINLKKDIPGDNDDDFGLPGLDLRQAQVVTKFPGLPRPENRPAQGGAVGATSALVQKLQAINPNDPMAVVSLGPKEHRLYMLYQRMVGASSGQPILPEDKDGNIIYEGVPSHVLYDPGHFYNKTIKQFLCPQAFCGKRFKTADALDAHLRSPVHMDNELRCPECADGFKTASALMAHLEAPSVNCYIRNSDIYKEALEVASGAFLSTIIDEDGKMKVIAQEPSW